jgi:pimeloyl-ACP methyl ester carboxylesterase
MKKFLKISGIVLAALFIILIITGLASRDRVEIPAGFAGSYLDLDGEKVRYFQKGSGKDVLLIHGLPGSIEDWDPVIDGLAAKYRVTAYDRPGFGFSSDSVDRHTVTGNAETAVKLMEKLGLRDAVVVGHSYGGGIALAMAARKTANVRGYVSLGGVSQPTEQVMFIFYMNRVPLIGRGLAAAGTALLGDSMMEEMVRLAFTPDMSILTPDYVHKRREMMFQTKVVMSLSAEEVRLNGDMASLQQAYPGIAARFIILHGDGDMMVPVVDSRKLAKALPNSVLKELPGTGHMVQFKHPGDVIAAVDAMFGK